MKYCCYILFGLLVFSSCKNKEVSQLEVEANGYSFRLMSKESEKASSDKLRTLVLEIESLSGKDLVQSLVSDSLTEEEIIYYFSYRLKDDIAFQLDNTVFPISFLHFERSYDLRISRSFLLTLSIPMTSKKSNLTLVVNSQLLGGEEVVIDLTQLELYLS